MGIPNTCEENSSFTKSGGMSAICNLLHKGKVGDTGFEPVTSSV